MVLLAIYVIILAVALYVGSRNIRRGRQAGTAQYVIGVALVVLSILWIVWDVTHWSH